MFESELIELIRLAYLSGVNDTKDGVEKWCEQGSKERAGELLQEFEDGGDLTATLG